MANLLDLKREARQLDADERAQLALDLLRSLDGEPSEAVDQQWNVVARERLGAYDRGEVTAEPADEVHRAARSRLR
ncbi:addiction module protein [Aquincola sp. S2]|uniref:Addiction module protein n=1 Tax=Pseudaquabacterium terrae TaxID=2732868 RepID=A0ABX2ENX9_9BURK|nr:addiction module protein [Aquabacterium terrae]NRF70384.1 addiction module protein [Aquabacterium terrae]